MWIQLKNSTLLKITKIWFIITKEHRGVVQRIISTISSIFCLVLSGKVFILLNETYGTFLCSAIGFFILHRIGGPFFVPTKQFS